jgi:hypothetical protein
MADTTTLRMAFATSSDKDMTISIPYAKKDVDKAGAIAIMEDFIDIQPLKDYALTEFIGAEVVTRSTRDVMATA